VFERFTGRARQVVVLAQDEVRTLGHEWIGVEHLLLALARDRDGLAAQSLAEAGAPYDALREIVARSRGAEDGVTRGQLPFTPRAKESLERSLRESLQLGHRYVGTEHMLLGLLRVSDAGPVAIVLYELRASPRSVAAHLMRRLGADDAAYIETFADFGAGPPAALTEKDGTPDRRTAVARSAELAVPILPGRDLHETLAFYEQLGFGAIGAPIETYDYLIVRRGTLELHFFHSPDIDPLTTDAMCYLRVHDADALYAEWAQRVADVEPPHDTPYGMREFGIVDPSGNLLRIGS